MEENDGRERKRKNEVERLQQRLGVVLKRLDQVYTDRLDGKVSDFWQRKTEEWQDEEQQILLSLSGREETQPVQPLEAVRILELANKAYFLYFRQDPAERAKLLKIVLSNCRVDAASLYPAYRKPFDLIFGAAKTGVWYALVDDFRTLPAGLLIPQVADLRSTWSP